MAPASPEKSVLAANSASSLRGKMRIPFPTLDDGHKTETCSQGIIVDVRKARTDAAASSGLLLSVSPPPPLVRQTDGDACYDFPGCDSPAAGVAGGKSELRQQTPPPQRQEDSSGDPIDSFLLHRSSSSQSEEVEDEAEEQRRRQQQQRRRDPAAVPATNHYHNPFEGGVGDCSRTEDFELVREEETGGGGDGDGVELELIESDANFCMPELGAEVIVVEEEREETLASPPAPAVAAASPPQQHQIHRVVDYSRRVSYEEMVHRDDDEGDDDSVESMEEDDHVPPVVDVSSAAAAERRSGCDNIGSEESQQQQQQTSFPNLEDCLVVLTRWALSLQEVREDRESGGVGPAPASRCLCAKADSLVLELKAIERKYMEVIELHDLAPGMAQASSSAMRDLARDLDAMQGLLRSSVSILVSQTPSPEAAARAAHLVAEVCDVRRYVKDATDSLVQLVCDLLGVSNCDAQRHRQLDAREEEEIREKVAHLNTSDEEEDEELRAVFVNEEEEGDKENQHNRKRKQQQKPKLDPQQHPQPLDRQQQQQGGGQRPPSTSPTSSPSKRPRRGRTMSAPVGNAETAVCVKLLETKRKAVRQNGLLQFVLWREALRAEKDRRLVEQLEEMEEEEDDRDSVACEEGGEDEAAKRRLSFH